MNIDEILPFQGGGECPVQYELDLNGVEYYIRFRHSWLTIDVDDEEEVVEQQLGIADEGSWSDKHTTVYLYLISVAIRSGTLSEVKLPTLNEATRHPMFVLGPLPRYHILGCDLDHQHSLDCWTNESYSPIEIAKLRSGG